LSYSAGILFCLVPLLVPFLTVFGLAGEAGRSVFTACPVSEGIVDLSVSHCATVGAKSFCDLELTYIPM